MDHTQASDPLMKLLLVWTGPIPDSRIWTLPFPAIPSLAGAVYSTTWMVETGMITGYGMFAGNMLGSFAMISVMVFAATNRILNLFRL